MSPSQNPTRVALLFGGVSPEHDVSILSASQVADGLRALAERRPLAVRAVYINHDGRFVWEPGARRTRILDDATPAHAGQGSDNPTAEDLRGCARWELEGSRPGTDVLPFQPALVRLTEERYDAVLLILHGPGGEDGRLQAAFDLARIPYTGSGAHASALALNKPHCQAVLNAAGLPIASSLLIGPDGVDPARAIETIGLPCVVKPANGGSSVGVTIVHDAEKLAEALELALEVDDAALVEKFVAGRELTCGVLELDGAPTPLPVTEIIPPEGRFFDYDAKYVAGESREVTPAQLEPAVTAEIQRLARLAHLAIGCRGFSRVDFILAANGRPVVLEVNTIPGMTATSLLPQAAAVHGIDFPALLGLMIDGARHD
jgi:D-alanine-D-alanine ligase